ncbi:hypothetical protein TURU_138206 [Turdus rufiventris]|nr:hypothetical protein TURU_138206 [Turdus rufiventris]
MVELRILHGGSKAVSRTRTLNFWRANFSLFNDLLRGIPWYRALADKRVQENWSIFKHHFLQAQDQCIPMSKKSGKGGRRHAWACRELLVNLKWNKEIYGIWNKGQVMWEDCRNIIRVFRHTMRKDKTHLGLSLARDIKDNKKGFYKYISSKRKIRENVRPLLNQMGVLETEDTEKVELLNAFFASVFTAEVDPQESQISEVREGVAKPLSIIFEKSWRMGEVPNDWRKANVIPIFKKDKKEDPGNYCPVNLISVPEKVMEHIILEVITKHEEENVTGSSQHGFTKGKSCLTNVTAFYDGMAGWVEGTAVDVVYLDFSKALRGQQWMLSTLTSARLLTLSPIAFS